MKFVILTGMSGAGKSTALKMMEDIGYFCVDNLPIALIEKFAELAILQDAELQKVAVGVDIRSGQFLEELEDVLSRLRQDGKKFDILFLDSTDEVLVKRYKETRRTHPLAGSERVDRGIQEERRRLKFLRNQADYIVDTSNMLTRELKAELEKIFIQNQDYKNLFITIVSFGFKYGIPTDSDLVFDVRFLPNPFYVEGLRTKTGNDREIQEYVMQFKEAGQFLDKLEDKEAYPEYNLNNPIDKYKKECLNELLSTVYYIEPRLLGGLDNKQIKVVVRMFDVLMETGEINSFVKIMENVIDMTAEERDELADTLKYTSLSRVNKTIQLLKDRAQSVANLKKLVYDENIAAGEINAIQPFIENNYWLLGEKYHLVSAEEPNFEEALRRFTYLLTGEKKKKGTVKIDSDNAKKQMDIFAIRQMPDGDIKRCIVVELKHPKINLAMKELNQVKKYMATILEEPNFKANNIEWEFYLIGNKYNNDIKREILNAKSHGEKSLVYYVDNCKIYVKTWTEIFTDFEINYDFLYDKLQLEQKRIIASTGRTREEILQQENKSSSKMPQEITLD